MKNLYVLIFLLVFISCKKDQTKARVDKELPVMNCLHSFPFVKESAAANYSVSVISGFYNNMTATYTPDSSGITKMEVKYTGMFSATNEYTLYYKACGTKLYQATNQEFTDSSLVIDINTPLQQVYEAQTYHSQDMVETNYHRMTNKLHKFTLNGKEYTGIRIATLVKDDTNYIEMGYTVFSPDYGFVEVSSFNEQRTLVSYE